MVGKNIDTYKVLQVLGSGGMGVVYKAQDTSLDRTVALKVMNPGLATDDRFLRRFKKEARALGRLYHPHIVTVFAFRHVDSHLFIVMEYVEGGTVSQRIKRQGPLAWHEALPIMRQTLLAIDFAHRKKVIHRDLKPSNVLLTPEGTAKVTDFGLAKIQEASSSSTAVTMTGFTGGTLLYMPPEQLEGLTNVDHRGDLYALGMMFYEMLAGRSPLQGLSSEFKILKAIDAHDFPPIHETCPDLPPALARLINRSTEREPEDRYQSAASMLEALETFAAAPHQQQRTRPPTPSPTIERTQVVRPASALQDDQESSSLLKFFKDLLAKARILPPGNAPPHRSDRTAPPQHPSPHTAPARPSPVNHPDPSRPAPFTPVAEVENAVEEPPLDEAPEDAKPWEEDQVPVSQDEPAALPGEAVDSRDHGEVPSPPPAEAASEASRPRDRVVEPEAPEEPDEVISETVAASDASLAPPPEAISAPDVESPALAPTQRVHSPPWRETRPPRPVEPVPQRRRSPWRVGAAVVAVVLVANLALWWFAGRDESPSSPAPQQATLSITTDPAGANLFVEGAPIGSSPVSDQAVQAGPLRLRAERDGYAPLDTTITVNADAAATLSLTLNPHPLAENTDDTNGQDDEEPPADETGSARVTSTPSGATIWMNGQSQGRTPRTLADLAPGTYRLELRRDGFEPYATTVTINAGATSTVSGTLDERPRTGAVRVVVRPFGDIYIDGDQRAEGTNAAFEDTLPAGEHRIRAEHAWGTWEKQIRVSPGQTQDVLFNFNQEFKVLVTSEPLNATIVIDGQPTQRTTPSQVSVRPGRHTFTVQKDGFAMEGAPRTMTIERDYVRSEDRIHFTLRPRNK